MISKEYINNPDYLKSSYLYNLTKFVYWPPNAFNFSVSPFLIGIFGNLAITTALINTLRDKKIQDREWKVNHFHTLESIEHCHMIFATGIELGLVKSFTGIKSKEILLIGDNIDGFCLAGGMINMVGNCPNYGYEINLKALQKARLNLNPDFLDLATLIE